MIKKTIDSPKSKTQGQTQDHDILCFWVRTSIESCQKKFLFANLKSGKHGGLDVSAVDSQQEGPRFESTICLRLFCVSLACSPRDCVGTLTCMQLVGFG